MLNTFSTHRIFGFLLTVLMLTSCSGGTSSNTGTGTPQAQNNSGGGNTTQSQTLTVRVPSLNYVATITKSTTINEITNTRRELTTQCTSLEANPFGSKAQVCATEVETAYNQALAFIRS